MTRINKFLASTGMCSRRRAEELVMAGKVTLNGVVVSSLSTRVKEGDRVFVKGKEVKQEEGQGYFILNKPSGFVCSNIGKKRVIDLFKDVPLRLFTVGRLDKETTGLLLVTNDGTFADEVIHPSRGLEKEYIAKTDQEVSADHLALLSGGIFIDGTFVRPLRVTKVRKGTIKVVISEGKKREVRLLLEAAGLKVVALKRVRIGPLVLGDLPVGFYRPLTEREIEMLLRRGSDQPALKDEDLASPTTNQSKD